jgi:Na+/H+ antiporter NhaD/arsenite permease-like protein
MVLAIFYVWDLLAYRKENPADVRRDRESTTALKLSGALNFVFLFFVILSVSVKSLAPYRELIMAAALLLSLIFTGKPLRRYNGFTFKPIVEVAILFAGIFVTMGPLLTLLAEKGASLGLSRPWQFFWLSGGLSSFLDNAPTYLTFFSLGESITRVSPLNLPIVAGLRTDLLAALSCGAVFMGANTYIGNGPNFMVKAIAEEQGMKVPHFFGYMLYSLCILMPIFVLVTFLFFR